MNKKVLAELSERVMKFRPSFGLLMKDFLAEDHDRVFLIADSARACRFECPEALKSQVVECGIAEQNMIGVAAGLAHGGKKPVVFAFSPFASERCFEQIRLDAAYSDLNIVIVGSECGVSMGTQGVTHFGWEDMAVMRSLPNMIVLCPADHVELYKCIRFAFQQTGPVYIRLTGGVPKALKADDAPLVLGQSVTLTTGTDAAIIAIGTMVGVALEAAQKLNKEGCHVSVINMISVKPLDEKAILDIAKAGRPIITLEEHSVVNGLGTAVTEAAVKSGKAVRIRKLGLPDNYPHSVSPYPAMLQDYGLTADAVAEQVRQMLE